MTVGPGACGPGHFHWTNTPMKIQGQLRIGRVQCSHQKDYISIELVDKDACIEFAEMHISLEDFARAVTSCQVEGTIEVHNLDRVGKLHEHKTVQVPFSMYEDKGKEEEALAPFEVDGWTANRSDLQNGHRTVSKRVATAEPQHFQKVGFTRWVEKAVAP